MRVSVQIFWCGACAIVPAPKIPLAAERARALLRLEGPKRIRVFSLMEGLNGIQPFLARR